METYTISNRRYLGNKYKLLPFIRETVERECEEVNSVFDAFSGTGSVASAFLDKKLIVNDMMYSNYLTAVTWFSPQQYSMEKLERIIAGYNEKKNIKIDNYMSVNFSNTYFGLEVCRKIGYIREDIENLFVSGFLNEKERAILITSLIYAMDRIANTCGHYDSYIQNAVYPNDISLALPILDYLPHKENLCFNEDANILASNVTCDLVYLDPPYNSRQYCDAYHLLENVARWEKPEVEGVAKKMDRSSMKSQYCKVTAATALQNLIEKLSCKYILLSYNNNGDKYQIRSNAKISDEQIITILQKKGEVKIFNKEFRAFSAGKSEILGNQERLFLCQVE